MSIVHVTGLTKTYEVYKKQPGLRGSLRALVKRDYQQVHAVKNISFDIEQGELVGFIGPNGAGKTTTLKTLSGLLHPTSGSVEVLGFNPWERKYDFLRNISLVMGQKNQLWWDLPAIESFHLAKEIYNIPDHTYKKNLKNLTSMLDLDEIVDVQVRKLSLGQRMKAELIAALIHSPKVLFLDEPTIGLDVVMQKTMRKFIKDYNSAFDGSIILTSHYMADVKELCKRVIIIDKGEIIYDGLLADVITKFASSKQIQATFSKEVDPAKLKRIKGYESHSENQLELQVKRQDVAKAASDLLKNFPVLDINIKEPDIEDVIRDVFSRK